MIAPALFSRNATSGGVALTGSFLRDIVGVGVNATNRGVFP